MKLAVLGAGAWGTAISISLQPRHAVTLWARDAAQAHALAATGINEKYLPGFKLSPNVKVVADFEAALVDCELALVATPSAGLRTTLKALAKANDAVPVLWLCKGFETESAQLPFQVAAAELPAPSQRGVLSGPSFASEVAGGLPTALTLASTNAAFGQRMARELHHERLRIYSADDVVGVEVAGAVKNVMAIASGISDGLGLGYNARAALITRGLAEITRLGLKLGGRIETFMGLAGAGDLVLTCTGDLSRNRNVGLQLAHGDAVAAILAKLGHVAEGVSTARAVNRLAQQLAIEMPITRAVCRILDEEVTAREVVKELLQRDPKAEHR